MASLNKKVASKIEEAKKLDDLKRKFKKIKKIKKRIKQIKKGVK